MLMAPGNVALVVFGLRLGRESTRTMSPLSICFLTQSARSTAGVVAGHLHPCGIALGEDLDVGVTQFFGFHGRLVAQFALQPTAVEDQEGCSCLAGSRSVILSNWLSGMLTAMGMCPLMYLGL
jgi:hypothetical protein